MLLINKSYLEIKKSKFYGYYYKIKDLKEIKEILTTLKKEHKKAHHIVYAYKIDNTAGKSDDKEPKGTAGLPLFNLLEKNNLNNTLLIVIRYFGGTKLGVGYLFRAYQKCGQLMLK